MGIVGNIYSDYAQSDYRIYARVYYYSTKCFHICPSIGSVVTSQKFKSFLETYLLVSYACKLYAASIMWKIVWTMPITCVYRKSCCILTPSFFFWKNVRNRHFFLAGGTESLKPMMLIIIMLKMECRQQMPWNEKEVLFACMLYAMHCSVKNKS